jgi:peptide subunit release factor 1 (eRF1)
MIAPGEAGWVAALVGAVGAVAVALVEVLGQDEDWVRNNAAFTCPECGKVFLVSGQIHRNGRDCPACGRSHAEVSSRGGAKSGGTAWIDNP